MIVKTFLDKNDNKIILYSERNVKDYLYNSALNFISDTDVDEHYLKFKKYSNISNKFFSIDVLCYICK